MGARAIRPMENTMSTPSGWYYAQGDPPGTVRLWNGHEWVGFPQRDPNRPIEAQQVVVGGGAHGQQRLKPFGVLAIVGLVLPAIAYLFQTYVFWRELGLVDLVDRQGLEATFAAPSGEAEEVLALQGMALLLIGLGSLVAGPLFVLWFFVAYRNMSKWAHTRYETWWAIVAWFVPFINLRRPSHIMQELCESSPREDHAGAINPVVAWAWWLIFICSGVAIRLLAVWGARSGDPGTIETIFGIAMVLSTAIAVAAILAMRLVQQISYHQDLRFTEVSVTGQTTALAAV